jgi:aminomethyltransferase
LISNNIEGVEIENSSDAIAQLAVQGPFAAKALQKLTTIKLDTIKYYTFEVGTFAGVDNVIVSATGYTGAGGFELYFYKENARQIWDAVFDAGNEFGIKPIGLGARDTLRLEMGFCLYGNDIDDNTSPIEAGLGWITKVNDTKNFIGKDLVLKVKSEGVKKRLRGFKMIDKGIPRHGYQIFNQNNELIGEVTSGTISPVLNIGIGMGYIHAEYASVGNEVYIQVRNKMLKAIVVKTPFI